MPMKQVMVSLDTDTVEKLKTTSEQTQIPLSALTRLAILRGLRQIDEDQVMI